MDKTHNLHWFEMLADDVAARLKAQGISLNDAELNDIRDAIYGAANSARVREQRWREKLEGMKDHVRRSIA